VFPAAAASPNKERIDVWEQHKTPEGRVYFYNTETNVTTWSPPAKLGGTTPPQAASAVASTPLTAAATTVTTETVEKPRSKLWALLAQSVDGDGATSFDRLAVASENLEDDAPNGSGSVGANSSTPTAQLPERRVLNICIGAELAGAKLKKTSWDKSPCGTPARKPAPDSMRHAGDGFDHQYGSICEALARRFPERTESGVSAASSSGWSDEEQ
jgi:hypothetical protein